MRDYPALRLLRVTLRALAALVLVTTVLFALAIVGDLFGSAVPVPLVWALRLGGAVLIATAGLLVAALLYAAGEVVTVVAAIEENLRRALAELDGVRVDDE